MNEEEKTDEIEEKFPDGLKKEMIHFPPKMLKNILRQNPRFNYDYTQLDHEKRRQCEQHTLRKLNNILQRSGTEYPQELPPLVEIAKQEQTQEWLSAHNYPENVAQNIYESHKSSMEGNNEGGFINKEQLNIFKDFETQIQKYDEQGSSYPGYCRMLDAPGGTGKTYLIETIAAYCALNQHLCLCSAFSGVAAQVIQ